MNQLGRAVVSIALPAFFLLVGLVLAVYVAFRFHNDPLPFLALYAVTFGALGALLGYLIQSLVLGRSLKKPWGGGR